MLGDPKEQEFSARGTAQKRVPPVPNLRQRSEMKIRIVELQRCSVILATFQIMNEELMQICRSIVSELFLKQNSSMSS